MQMKINDGSFVEVKLQIKQYEDSGCMCIALMQKEGEEWRTMGNLTTDDPGNTPAYCGYVDNETHPNAMDFITEHGLGRFSGIAADNGISVFPLVIFDVEKLRKLCPEDMQQYEQNIEMLRKIPKETRSR